MYIKIPFLIPGNPFFSTNDILKRIKTTQRKAISYFGYMDNTYKNENDSDNDDNEVEEDSSVIKAYKLFLKRVFEVLVEFSDPELDTDNKNDNFEYTAKVATKLTQNFYKVRCRLV